MLRNILVLFTLIFLLSACMGIKHPQSAQEFRNVSAKAKTIVTESYQVNRSFKKIAKTFRKNAKKCLQGTVRSTSTTSAIGQGVNSYQVINTTYVPTVRVSKSKVELHLQQRHRGNVMNVSKAPKDGYYMYVLDVASAGKNKSKVKLYRPRWGYKHITRALKGWVDGTNNGCPDLTKVK